MMSTSKGFNPILSTPYTDGTSASGGETYHGHNDGPSSNDIKPLPDSSTSPGQSPGGGEYNPVGHDGSPTFGDVHGQMHPSKQVEAGEGYHVLGSVDVLDRPIPNDNGGRNYEHSYFEEPDNEGE